MSGYLFHDLPKGPAHSRIWFATIAKTVTDFNEKAMVLIPEFSPHNEVGPCFWQARNSTDMPQKGHRCIVVFDNRQQPWVLGWWPFAS